MEELEQETAAAFAGVAERPIAEPESAPAPHPRYGIAFYQTISSRQYRAKIGPVEAIQSLEREGLEPAIVAPVMTTESHESAEELGAELALALAALRHEELVLIGEVPKAFALAPPASENWPAVGPRASDEAPSERLLDLAGVPMDKRRMALMVALDRRFSNFMDRRAQRILVQLAQDKSIPEAVADANRFTAGTAAEALSDRAGYELVQQQVFLLAMQAALIQNRELVPEASRLP